MAMSMKAVKGPETPLVLENFTPTLFRTILPTPAHSILAASQMTAHVWKQCARSDSSSSIDYSMVLESAESIGGGSGLSELVCGPTLFAGDARDVYYVLSSYNNALSVFNLRFIGHRGGYSMPDVRLERNPVDCCRNFVQYVERSLPRFTEGHRVSGDVHEADKIERILSIIDLCGATLLHVESLLIPCYARHGATTRNAYMEDYFYATHIEDDRVMRVALLEGASDLVSRSNSLFPIGVVFDSVVECRSFFRQTIRFIISQRIGYRLCLDGLRAKLHNANHCVVYMSVIATNEMIRKYNIMKERTLSCVVDQFGKPISRAMFLNSSSGRLEFRVHVGTLIKPENCDPVSIETAIRVSNESLRSRSCGVRLSGFVVMKDEPMTACYRIFAKVEECDDSITDILKKICERSGCKMERMNDLLSCVASSHHVDANGFPSGHSNVVSFDISKMSNALNDEEIGRFSLGEVVVGVMDKTLTGPDTELFGMCHRCVNVLQ